MLYRALPSGSLAICDEFVKRLFMLHGCYPFKMKSVTSQVVYWKATLRYIYLTPTMYQGISLTECLILLPGW